MGQSRTPEHRPRGPLRRLRALVAGAITAGLLATAGPLTQAAAQQAAAPEVAAVAAPGDDWLHTRGNKIVDANGDEVWLTGANWFGFNASERVFHGLWSGNITGITKSMADRGINMVRVPISTQLLLEWKNGQATVPNVNTHANPEIAGKTSLEIFDFWLALCKQYGIKVMLDVHSAEADNSGHVYPVWWKGSITPEQFYSAWEWVTARYRNDDTLVAMDVKNEPHGKANETPRAKWDGSTDQDNFKYACETAGKRILAINPNLLVLCEGIEVYPKAGVSWTSTTPTDYYSTWWGGNLRGVRDHPVDLGANNDQLVYSPHDYGPLVYAQPWFTGDWNRTTLERDVWDPNWLYLHKENKSPLLIGEWGGFLDGGPNQKWMTALRDLIVEHRIHQTFWCINPNSGDTGGLLLGDWKSWDEQKYALLKPALWQHGGKFVSLDHEVPLGGAGSTTGISLRDVYGDGGGDPDPVDTTAPTAPAGLTSTAKTSTSVSLSWTAATDNVRVTGYDVYRGTVKVNAAPVTGTTYTDTGLTPSTAYSYSVRARDAAGNVSAPSAVLSVTTDAGSSPSGGVKVRYKNNDASATDNAIRPGLQVVNTGSSALDLRTVSARYYFTRDGGSPSVSAWCDYAAVGCAQVKLRVVPLTTPVTGADAYLEVTFSGGSLAAGRDTGDIQLRMSKSDWSNFNEANDYSRTAWTAYADAPAIPAYSGTTLAWGAPPAA
ncbi:cellulase family glycosylhydrolase [Streptomyces sp. CB03234]|uniref:cellulase family glycosylhydrolase n=1 Tax=Streptomyces sp. (strain CB03234) TaxID=1703937 RepID=UPI000A761F02|nr:cellulase family glycosylhydrolase [Streptomyces sp. CB03234]